MRVTLTADMVRKAKPGSNRVFLWDAQIPGLGLVVHPTGRKTWVFQGAISGGRRVSIEASSLAAARKAALVIKAGLEPEVTPVPETPEVDASKLTVNDILDLWLDSLAARAEPPVSLKQIRSCVDNHIRPRIGRIRFDKLTRVKVIALRDALAARGTRGMANQTVAYFRAALRWAEDAEIIPEAPRWRVPRLRLGSRAHSLTDDQWSRLVQLLNDGEAGLHPIGRLALLVLTLTGCRKSEVTSLRWDAVGPDGALRLDRHKTSGRSGTKTVPWGS